MNSTTKTTKTTTPTKNDEELQKIITTLQSGFIPLQRKYHISELCIVGSYARGEQTETSDIDIMVDFSEPIGWEVEDLRDALEAILGLEVDLILKGGVIQRKRLYTSITEDAIYIRA